MNEQKKIWKKLISVLFGMAALDTLTAAIGFVVGPLLVVELTGSYKWSGLPGTVLLFSGALAALSIRNYLDKYGYRLFLATAVFSQSLGAMFVLLGDIKHSLTFVLIGFAFWGGGRGILGLGRYAAGEISPRYLRARAIGLVVFGGALGALLSPTILKYSKNVFQFLNWGDNAGPLIAAAMLFITSGLIGLFFLFPEPKKFKLEETDPKTGVSDNSEEVLEFSVNKGLGFGMLSMVMGHIVMVFIMSITPVYMKSCHYALEGITWVISLHIFGMFGLSFLTGWFIDKLGSVKGITVGCSILMLSSLLSGFAGNYPLLLSGLFLLGLGWNFCFLAGSKLIVSYGISRGLGKIQSLNDSILYLGAGFASLSSGFFFEYFSFMFMAWIGVGLSVIPLLAIFFWLKPMQDLEPASKTA